MRRAAVTIVATVVGLVLLLQFKVHSTSPSLGALAAVTPSPGATTRTQPHQQHTPQASPPGATKAKRTTPARRTITGQTIQTRYGPVQVQIVETAGKLTNVTALQLPHGDPHSDQVAASAAPVLRAEALRAGNAHIDVVSGATYTSDGYAQSLQSALDNA
jgi:uncharacterized protein with FMN-binding domain